VYHFPNKFATKWYKCFAPQPSNVSIYLVKLEMHIGHWTGSNSRIYFTSTVAPNLPDLNPVDYSVRGLLRQKVYKIRITDMNKLKQRLKTEWVKLDHVVIAAAVYCRWQLQISDAYFVHHLISCNSSTCFYQLHSNLANLEDTVEVG